MMIAHKDPLILILQALSQLMLANMRHVILCPIEKFEIFLL